MRRRGKETRQLDLFFLLSEFSPPPNSLPPSDDRGSASKSARERGTERDTHGNYYISRYIHWLLYTKLRGKERKKEHKKPRGEKPRVGKILQSSIIFLVFLAFLVFVRVLRAKQAFISRRAGVGDCGGRGRSGSVKAREAEREGDREGKKKARVCCSLKKTPMCLSLSPSRFCAFFRYLRLSQGACQTEHEKFGVLGGGGRRWVEAMNQKKGGGEMNADCFVLGVSRPFPL